MTDLPRELLTVITHGRVTCSKCDNFLPTGLSPAQRDARNWLCDTCLAAQRHLERQARPRRQRKNTPRPLLHDAHIKVWRKHNHSQRRLGKQKERFARLRREGRSRQYIVCKACGETKHRDEFADAPTLRTGKSTKCGACTKAEFLEYQRNYQEKKRRAQGARTREQYLAESTDAMSPNKTCTVCGETKPRDHFPKGGRCISCHRVKERERDRRRRLKNPPAPKPPKPTLSPEERAARAKESKRRAKEKARKDPMHRINRNFSENIRRQFRNMRQGKSCGGWKQHVGYTLLDLKRHLESQFTEGMTWDNYGEWHIDHIIPKSAFTFTAPDDPRFLACWALDNLRPLWAKENSSKCDTIPDTHLTEYVTIMCFPELV
jgi:hypothetical protein